MDSPLIGGIAIMMLVALVVLTADDIKHKRSIEAQQDAYVAQCGEKQDPNIFDYVERLKGCRQAAELKFKMPKFLDRVR